MSVINVNLEDNYKCKTDDQVITVSIGIGDGQGGSSTVFLGTDSIDSLDNPNPSDNLEQFELGTKTTVGDQKATIVTVVKDTLAETNWTSVTITLKEGKAVTTFGPYKKLAAENLDTVIYSLQLHFQ